MVTSFSRGDHREVRAPHVWTLTRQGLLLQLWAGNLSGLIDPVLQVLVRLGTHLRIPLTSFRLGKRILGCFTCCNGLFRQISGPTRSLSAFRISSRSVSSGVAFARGLQEAVHDDGHKQGAGHQQPGFRKKGPESRPPGSVTYVLEA